MSKYTDLLLAVTSDPESDAARLAFAAYVKQSDPERAQFIEQQIAAATSRRACQGIPDSQPPIVERRTDWHRTLAKYTSSLRYDRGFVAGVSIEPYLFLEEGKWLFTNAPIRVVTLDPPEGGPFPAAELADSPLLAHLDALMLAVPGLSGSDVERLARSPHLGRMQMIHTHVKTEVTLATYQALATIPAARKLLDLSVGGEFPGENYGPTGGVDWNLDDIIGTLPMGPEGRAIEAEYGYVPWLHHENMAESIDAAYYVEHGILPKRPVGAR